MTPPIFFFTFSNSFIDKRYLSDPKVEKNNFSKSPSQNISKLGLNNAHMIILLCCISLNETMAAEKSGHVCIV